jgi:hypothetical protein
MPASPGSSPRPSSSTADPAALAEWQARRFRPLAPRSSPFDDDLPDDPLEAREESARILDALRSGE